MTDPAEQPTTGMPNLDLEAGSRFIAAAGLVVDEVSGTRLRGHLDVGPEHHTPWGVVHGGVYTTAVESAASIGASTAVADRGQFAVGVHNATDFLRPSTGGRAEVLAVPLQQGRTQAAVACDNHQRPGQGARPRTAPPAKRAPHPVRRLSRSWPDRSQRNALHAAGRGSHPGHRRSGPLACFFARSITQDAASFRCVIPVDR